MSDTTIVGRRVEVAQAEAGAVQSPFSWGAAVAGALAAIAISFILIALGAGIGLLTASPYNVWPSMGALTALGAVWIVLAQTWGYACGGYIAGRMRTRMPEVSSDETNFRDGVHGLVSWALGVVLVVAMVGLATMFAAGTTAHVGATLGAGAASGAGSAMQGQASGPADTTGYFADLLLRPEQSGTQAAVGQDQRAEVTRIMAYSVAQGRMADADRAYLARMVAQRSGVTQAEAEQRVAATEQRLRESAKEAGDKAAKAASMFSFWTFMSLLMGAAAATLGGIFGGNQRDDEWFGTPAITPNR